MRYIHYGHDSFDINKFNIVKNQEFSTKPFGGLWASRVGDKNGWKEWLETNEFSFEIIDSSFEFSLRNDAKILTIDNVKILNELPRTKMQKLSKFRVLLDFEKLAKEYDAIEILVSKDFALSYQLYGWDCDSILILNPNIILF